MKTRGLLLLTLAVLGFGLLGWHVWRDDKIAFLPADKRAEWIIFPTALSTATRPLVNLDTVFRRTFEFPAAPQTARLLVRAARHCEIQLNGRKIIPHLGNWKQVASADVTNALRSGGNEIRVTVFNRGAPPALWLSLATDQGSISTDKTWDASFTFSEYRKAARASQPRFPGPGNLAFGAEKMRDVLPRVWPLGLALAATGALLIYGWQRWLAPLLPADTWPKAVFAGIAVLWLALFLNNTGKLPFPGGFDADPHADYIRYIQERRALPLPNEGFEMYQPPLYYMISAGVLSVGRLSPIDPAGVHTLRALTFLFGLAHLLFIFLTLRLLFPGRPGPQIAGLAVAGFLPMHLSMSHYLTNETLCAALVAATIYFTVRLLRTDAPAPFRFAVPGLLLGAALLTKATALLLAPLLFLALAVTFVRQNAGTRGSLSRLAVFGVAVSTVGGWHYLRIWRHFGRPLVGNWEPAAGFAWWQDPGYHTWADYFRFGRALTQPFFSGLNGFWDGIYSTLWGDGLWGGVSDLASRPPWNYGLVTSGYLAALPPAILIGAGAVLAGRRFLKSPDAAWFVLLGWIALLFGAVAFMTLKVAAVGQVRAVYGLSAVISLASLAALAWDRATRNQPRIAFLFAVLLFAWAGNSYASHWIRGSADLYLYQAIKYRSARQPDKARAAAERAVESAPDNPRSHVSLSQILGDAGEDSAARNHAERAIELRPNDTDARLQFAAVLSKGGEKERAVQETQRAVTLGPENAAAHAMLLSLSRGAGEEALTAASRAMTVIGFSAEAHYVYGLALAGSQTGDFSKAAEQFVYALLLRPGWQEPRTRLVAALSAATDETALPDYGKISRLAGDSPIVLNDIGWLLATSPNDKVRNGKEAVRLAELALRTARASSNPTLLTTLAAAYGEEGRFAEAKTRATEARAAAERSGHPHLIKLSDDMLASFREMRPYRQP